MTNPFFCSILIPETKNNYFTERKTHHDQSVFCLWICVRSRLLQWRIRLCEACSYQDKQKVRFGLMRWIHPNTILSELRKPLVLCEASGFLRPLGLQFRKRRCLSWTFPRLIWPWPGPISWISGKLPDYPFMTCRWFSVSILRRQFTNGRTGQRSRLLIIWSFLRRCFMSALMIFWWLRSLNKGSSLPNMVRSSNWSGHSPFKAVTPVQVRCGSPYGPFV